MVRIFNLFKRAANVRAPKYKALKQSGSTDSMATIRASKVNPPRIADREMAKKIQSLRQGSSESIDSFQFKKPTSVRKGRVSSIDDPNNPFQEGARQERVADKLSDFTNSPVGRSKSLGDISQRSVKRDSVRSDQRLLSRQGSASTVGSNNVQEFGNVMGKAMGVSSDVINNATNAGKKVVRAANTVPYLKAKLKGVKSHIIKNKTKYIRAAQGISALGTVGAVASSIYTQTQLDALKAQLNKANITEIPDTPTTPTNPEPKPHPPVNPDKPRIDELNKLINNLEAANAALRRKVESTRPKDRAGIRQTIADNEKELDTLRRELSRLMSYVNNQPTKDKAIKTINT